MSWTVTTGVCVAIASSAVTLAMVAETQPYINEDGEEEYTLSGYLLLATAYVIKWPFKLAARLIKSRNEEPNYNNVVMFNTKQEEEQAHVHNWMYDPRYHQMEVEAFEPHETENEYELVV